MASENVVGIAVKLEGAQKAIEELKKVKDAASNAATDGINKIGKATDDLASSFSSAYTGFKGFTDKLKENIVPIVAAIGTLKKAFDFSKQAADFEDMSEAFTKSFGIDSVSAINRLNEAADGTISKANLIRIATRAMATGATTDMTQLARLLEIARVKADQMGVSTEEAFDQITQGIGKATPKMLESLGFQVDAWTKEADAKRVSIDRQYLLNQVLKDGQVDIENNASQTRNAADIYEQFSASIDNLKLALGKGLLPIAVKVVDVLGGVAEYAAWLAGGLKGIEADAVAREKASYDTLKLTVAERRDLNRILDEQIALRKKLAEKKDEIFTSEDDKKEIAAMEQRNDELDNEIMNYYKLSNAAKIKAKQDDESARIAAKEAEIKKRRDEEAKRRSEEEAKWTKEQIELANERTRQINYEAQLNTEAKKALEDRIKIERDRVKVQEDFARAGAKAADAMRAQNISIAGEMAQGFGAGGAQVIGGIGAVSDAAAKAKEAAADNQTASNQMLVTAGLVGAIIALVRTIAGELKGIATGVLQIFGASMSAEMQKFLGVLRDIAEVIISGPGIGAIIMKFQEWEAAMADFTSNIIAQEKQLADQIVQITESQEDRRLAALEKGANERYQKAVDEAYKLSGLEELKAEEDADRREALVQAVADAKDAEAADDAARALRQFDAQQAYNAAVKAAEEKRDTELKAIQDARDANEKKRLNAQLEIQKLQIQAQKVSALAQATQVAGFYWDESSKSFKSNSDKAVAAVNAAYDPIIAQMAAIPAFAKGGSFITNGPQPILVGDNPGGREMVSVTPLGAGQSKASGATFTGPVTITANSPEQFFDAIQRYQRQNGAFA